MEKERYGENSYSSLCEQVLFQKPRYKSDYVDQDNNSDKEDCTNNHDTDHGDMALSDTE